MTISDKALKEPSNQEAIFEHLYSSFEPFIVEFFKRNPSYLLEIYHKVINDKIEGPINEDHVKTILSLKWPDVMELARAVKDVELTNFYEVSEFTTPLTWKLAVLSRGVINNAKVSYACFDGKKVIWVTSWNTIYDLQPGAIYDFEISKSVVYPAKKEGGYDSYNASLVPAARPLIVKTLLKDIPHTPIPPLKKE